jgi:hypothetical protein
MSNRVVALLVCVGIVCAVWCARVAAQPPMPSQELPAGAEVLNRGPVNEAFAEPISVEDQTGLVAPREPPVSIDEVPPQDRPAGSDYVWVPGYWSWDSDRNDFIWVGACWRAAPPKMYWVPGYWAPMAEGWEWVPGFWAQTGAREIEYLPAPPAPEEIEAPGSPPDPDRLWVPGCWYWTRNQYAFRPGYWLQARDGWVWTPSHYSWTPRGYVFIAGYWDYAFDTRGVVFAPIYFPASVYATAGFSFSPAVVIDLGAVTFSLFAYPRYSHYFFGDFYDDSYIQVGIYPLFDVDRFHTWYDPVYEYDRWHFRRSDPQWDEHRREDYDRMRSNQDARPPRTYRELQTRMASVPEPQRRDTELVRPLQQVVTQKSTTVRFESMSPESRQQIATSGSEVNRFRTARSKWEAPVSQPSPPAAATPPSRQTEKGTAPPARPEATRQRQAPALSGTPPRAPEASPPPAPARHEVRVTQPERVKVQPPPPPPVVSKERGKPQEPKRAAPPAAPKEESKTKTKAKQAQQPQQKQRGK